MQVLTLLVELGRAAWTRKFWKPISAIALAIAIGLGQALGSASHSDGRPLDPKMAEMTRYLTMSGPERKATELYWAARRLINPGGVPFSWATRSEIESKIPRSVRLKNILDPRSFGLSDETVQELKAFLTNPDFSSLGRAGDAELRLLSEFLEARFGVNTYPSPFFFPNLLKNALDLLDFAMEIRPTDTSLWEVYLTALVNYHSAGYVPYEFEEETAGNPWGMALVRALKRPEQKDLLRSLLETLASLPADHQKKALSIFDSKERFFSIETAADQESFETLHFLEASARAILNNGLNPPDPRVMASLFENAIHVRQEMAERFHGFKSLHMDYAKHIASKAKDYFLKVSPPQALLAKRFETISSRLTVPNTLVADFALTLSNRLLHETYTKIAEESSETRRLSVGDHFFQFEMLRAERQGQPHEVIALNIKAVDLEFVNLAQVLQSFLFGTVGYGSLPVEIRFPKSETDLISELLEADHEAAGVTVQRVNVLEGVALTFIPNACEVSLRGHSQSDL